MKKKNANTAGGPPGKSSQRPYGPLSRADLQSMSRRELEERLLSYQQTGGGKENDRGSVVFDKDELRRKAEDRLRHAPRDVSTMKPLEIQELIYELQVHQMELEMMVEELRSNQANLARAHGQYRELYEDAPVGYLTLDADETVVRANATAGTMLQRSVKQLQGKRFSSLAAHEDQDNCYLYIRKVMQGLAPQTADIRFKRFVDKQIIHVRLGTMRTTDAGGTLKSECRVGMMDITAAKKAELALKDNERRLHILNENLESLVVQRTEQVTALSTALTLAEQRERKQFSQILHENIQQKLYGARMLFKQYLREHEDTATNGQQWDDMAEGIEVLEKALRTAKALSIELNPPVLSSEGLDAALWWLVAHMLTTYGFTVELRMQGPVCGIRHRTQIMLTQMIRELLNNVKQHAGVSEALVEVRCEEKYIHITISDKGRGFNPQEELSEETDKSSLGLLSIRERLRLFGGDLTIQSTPGQGTQVTIVLPFKNY